MLSVRQVLDAQALTGGGGGTEEQTVFRHNYKACYDHAAPRSVLHGEISLWFIWCEKRLVYRVSKWITTSCEGRFFLIKHLENFSSQWFSLCEIKKCNFLRKPTGSSGCHGGLKVVSASRGNSSWSANISRTAESATQSHAVRSWGMRACVRLPPCWTRQEHKPRRSFKTLQRQKNVNIFETSMLPPVYALIIRAVTGALDSLVSSKLIR